MNAFFGKTLIIIGLSLAAMGGVFLWNIRIPWLGRLPGDIHLKNENFQFFFPLTTCLLISLLVSFVLYLLRK